MHIISSSAKISKLTDFETSVRSSKLIIEDDVKIDSFVKIKFVGGEGDVKIGKRSFINSGCVIYSGNGLSIGEDVLIAANCVFAPVNHEYKLRSQTIISQRFKKSKGGIIVEDDVWIGAGAIILDGAIIKKGTVIGAGCIVNFETEEYGIYVGSPISLKGFRV